MIFSASVKALENCNSYGADDILEKPFSITNLLYKIENLLSAKQKNAAS